MGGGSYTLLIEMEERKEMVIGALGKTSLREGFYAYNGSALGPGGFKRVDRHRKVSNRGGKNHWHIDYLLSVKASSIYEVFKTYGADIECSLSLPNADEIPGFGCSDCSCDSHLFYSESRVELRRQVKERHQKNAPTNHTEISELQGQ